jgi:hypothetical protein
LSGQDQLQPDLVAPPPVEGEVLEAGGLGGVDAVLDPGAVAVPQLQGAQIRVGLVGEEDLEAVAVVVAERSWAPGWASSRRQTALVPGGQVCRSIQPVSSTMLAGRMSFFDLGRPSQAEPYYQDALEAAQEAQDRPLQAVVLGNKSFLPRSRGDFAAALEAAEGVLDDATPGATPEWFDYYDRPRLAGFKGQVHIRLAQPAMAHAVLEEAIGALDPDAAKQRACYLADQAAVCVDEGEVDQACQLGIQALRLLGAVEYETGVRRVRDLRAKLRPWRNHPAVADLTEQLLLVS